MLPFANFSWQPNTEKLDYTPEVAYNQFVFPYISFFVGDGFQS